MTNDYDKWWNGVVGTDPFAFLLGEETKDYAIPGATQLVNAWLDRNVHVFELTVGWWCLSDSVAWGPMARDVGLSITLTPETKKIDIWECYILYRNHDILRPGKTMAIHYWLNPRCYAYFREGHWGLAEFLGPCIPIAPQWHSLPCWFDIGHYQT